MGLIKELIKENVDLRNLLVEQNEKIDIQSDKLNEQNTMLSDIQKKDNVTINQNNTQKLQNRAADQLQTSRLVHSSRVSVHKHMQLLIRS